MAFLSEAFRLPSPLTDDAPAGARCTEHVTGNSRLSPAEQVDIYRRQFWLRHLDSLTDDYPGVKLLLGEEGFEAFCRAYLLAYPPRHPSLRDLGTDILPFAIAFADFPQALRPVVLEMVRYENALVDVFDGADVPPLDPHKLASLPEDAWERARLVVHPLLRFFRLEYPVHRLRLTARKAQEAPEGAAEVPAAPLVAPLVAPPDKVPTCLVLYRHGTRIRFEELEPVALDLLEALARGEPLGAACERIAASLAPAEAEAFGSQVGSWFQQWTAFSWIVDVEL
jgi:hypothetical protein